MYVYVGDGTSWGIWGKCPLPSFLTDSCNEKQIDQYSLIEHSRDRYSLIEQSHTLFVQFRYKEYFTAHTNRHLTCQAGVVIALNIALKQTLH